MNYPNPYTPGAGTMPDFLAGREKVLTEAKRHLEALKLGYPQQSVIYYGLRGVGKTVLLNAIEEQNFDSRILMEHIEIAEKKNFIAQITNSSKKIIHKMSFKESAKDFIKKTQDFLKAFSLTYNTQDQSVSVRLNELEYTTSGDLSDDLTELFVSMGRMASQTQYPICFFIDEIQYMKDGEVEALINAIHRCNQLRLPLMIFGAGLPKIIRMMGKIKTYSERLFRFEEIDALCEKDAREAIEKPAEKLGVCYTQEALDKIIGQAKGYPYFLQELASIIWKNTPNTSMIEIHDVNSSIPIFLDKLDQGFYKMRFDRCTHYERMFIFAMVKCGDLPCTISNVAKILRKDVKSISTSRAKLINKGIIYATDYAEIDFTVPGFDDFLRRINPKLSLDFDK